MSTTLPSIVPSGYAGDITDFLKAKVDKSGASRIISGVVAIPNTTASATLVGLFPFNANARLHSIKFYSDDLDSSTNVTVSIGFQYYDSATGSSNTQAFYNSSTLPQAGGWIPLTSANSVGNQFAAAGDGWVIARIGNTTTQSGNFSFNAILAYDNSGVTV